MWEANPQLARWNLSLQPFDFSVHLSICLGLHMQMQTSSLSAGVGGVKNGKVYPCLHSWLGVGGICNKVHGLAAGG